MTTFVVCACGAELEVVEELTGKETLVIHDAVAHPDKYVPKYRAVTVGFPTELLRRLMGLPDDVRIGRIYATDFGGIKMVLESDVRFEPVPEGTAPPDIFPVIELRLMAAAPVTGDTMPQHPPNPGDVMFARYVLDETTLPRLDVVS